MRACWMRSANLLLTAKSSGQTQQRYQMQSILVLSLLGYLCSLCFLLIQWMTIARRNVPSRWLGGCSQMIAGASVCCAQVSYALHEAASQVSQGSQGADAEEAPSKRVKTTGKSLLKSSNVKAALQNHIGAPCMYCKPCRALWWPADYCAFSCAHLHLWFGSGEDISAASQDVCGEAVAGGRVKGCQEPR